MYRYDIGIQPFDVW